MTRLILVSGKGGVGKSALAASLALAHHRAGARVLAIDVAATGGLAAHLGVASLAFKAQTIKTGLNALAVDRSKGGVRTAGERAARRTTSPRLVLRKLRGGRIGARAGLQRR
jgi:anion-transporting  ArsA/GET3 family ATPase